MKMAHGKKPWAIFAARSMQEYRRQRSRTELFPSGFFCSCLPLERSPAAPLPQEFGSFTSGISSRLMITSISSSLAHSSGENRWEIRCITSTMYFTLML